MRLRQTLPLYVITELQPLVARMFNDQQAQGDIEADLVFDFGGDKVKLAFYDETRPHTYVEVYENSMTDIHTRFEVALATPTRGAIVRFVVDNGDTDSVNWAIKLIARTIVSLMMTNALPDLPILIGLPSTVVIAPGYDTESIDPTMITTFGIGQAEIDVLQEAERRAALAVQAGALVNAMPRYYGEDLQRLLHAEEGILPTVASQMSLLAREVGDRGKILVEKAGGGKGVTFMSATHDGYGAQLVVSNFVAHGIAIELGIRLFGPPSERIADTLLKVPCNDNGRKAAEIITGYFKNHGSLPIGLAEQYPFSN